MEDHVEGLLARAEDGLSVAHPLYGFKDVDLAIQSVGLLKDFADSDEGIREMIGHDTVANRLGGLLEICLAYLGECSEGNGAEIQSRRSKDTSLTQSERVFEARVVRKNGLVLRFVEITLKVIKKLMEAVLKSELKSEGATNWISDISHAILQHMIAGRVITKHRASFFHHGFCIIYHALSLPTIAGELVESGAIDIFVKTLDACKSVRPSTLVFVLHGATRLVKHDNEYKEQALIGGLLSATVEVLQLFGKTAFDVTVEALGLAVQLTSGSSENNIDGSDSLTDIGRIALDFILNHSPNATNMMTQCYGILNKCLRNEPSVACLASDLTTAHFVKAASTCLRLNMEHIHLRRLVIRCVAAFIAVCMLFWHRESGKDEESDDLNEKEDAEEGEVDDMDSTYQSTHMYPEEDAYRCMWMPSLMCCVNGPLSLRVSILTGFI